MIESDQDCVLFVGEHYEGIHDAFFEMGAPRAPNMCCALTTMSLICKALEEELSVPNYSELSTMDQAVLVLALCWRGMEKMAATSVDVMLADVFGGPDA